MKNLERAQKRQKLDTDQYCEKYQRKLADKDRHLERSTFRQLKRGAALND